MRTLTSLLLAVGIASGPAFAQGGFLGISLEDGTADAAGAVVASVEARSAAAVVGLRAGDRITRVDAVEVADARALAALIGARLPGEVVELQIVRDGEPQDLLAVLGRRPAPAGSVDLGPRSRFRVMPPAPPMPPLPPEAPEPPAWDDVQDDDGAFRFAIPPLDFRGFEFEEFAPQMESLREQMQELQLRHHELMREFQEQWREHSQDLRQRAEVFVLPRGGADGETHTRVQLRYPEATPEAEREKLRAEAIAKYGPEVEIEFSGTGTSVRIERTVTRAGSEPPPAPPAPDEGKREF